MTDDFLQPDPELSTRGRRAAAVAGLLGQAAATLRFFDADDLAGEGRCSSNNLDCLEKWVDPGCLAPPDSRTLLEREVAACDGCALCREPVHRIKGAGGVPAPLMFVGGWPEKTAARAEGLFAGEAGAMLGRMITAMKLTPETVYVTCAVKCRPPDERPPRPGEAEACRRFLEREIRLVRPKIICALGAFAAERLLPPDGPLETIRGRFHRLDGPGGSTTVMPTWHPADVLARPEKKRPLWADLQAIMAALQPV
ncbi:MAG: uracil-DNA glycosylase [Desulfosudaceae bacterium]